MFIADVELIVHRLLLYEMRFKMIRPARHGTLPEIAYQAFKPRSAGVDRREQEMCFHLPFALVYEDLTY